MELRKKITNFVDVLLEKAVHAQLGHHIIYQKVMEDLIKLCTVKVVSKLLASAVGIFLNFSCYQDLYIFRSFISCCFYQLLHQEISFSQIIRNSFHFICIKDFHQKFSFLMAIHSNPPPPYRPKSTKHDESFC